MTAQERLLDTEREGVQLPVYPKALLPSAAEDGVLIFVIDEAGGAVPAFSFDGAWRRVTDRAVVS